MVRRGCALSFVLALLWLVFKKQEDDLNDVPSVSLSSWVPLGHSDGSAGDPFKRAGNKRPPSTFRIIDMVADTAWRCAALRRRVVLGVRLRGDMQFFGGG